MYLPNIPGIQTERGSERNNSDIHLDTDPAGWPLNIL